MEEFELYESKCLQLPKPLYGLCESRDLCHKTLDRHHHEELKISAFRAYPALYKLVINGVLHGLSSGYIDELIKAGDWHYRRIAQGTREKFDVAEDNRPPCNFTGLALTRSRSLGWLYANVPAYVPAHAGGAATGFKLPKVHVHANEARLAHTHTTRLDA